MDWFLISQPTHFQVLDIFLQPHVVCGVDTQQTPELCDGPNGGEICINHTWHRCTVCETLKCYKHLLVCYSCNKPFCGKHSKVIGVNRIWILGCDSCIGFFLEHGRWRPDKEPSD